MNESTVLALARLTRPILGGRVPLLYPVVRGLLKLVYPRGGRHRHALVAPYDRGLLLVDTASSFEYTALFRGCFEPAVMGLIRHGAPPGGTVLDVGANVGLHTLVMAHAVGAHGRVVAVEPEPRLARRLRANLDLNGAAHVEVVEAALCAEDGPVELFTFAEDDFRRGLSSLRAGTAAGADRRIEVRGVSGATLARALAFERLDLVKIDVEGADLLVLEQLRPLIERHGPTLVMEHRREHWARFGAHGAGAVALLAELGYSLYVITGRDALLPLDGDLPESCEILAVRARDRRVAALEPAAGGS